MPLWGVEGIAFLCSLVVVSIFLYHQYSRDNKSIYYSPDQRVLFPVHLYLLTFYNFTTLVQTAMLAVLLSLEIRQGPVWAVGNAAAWAFNHAFMGERICSSFMLSF